MQKEAMPAGRQVYEFISKQTGDPIIEWRVCAISGKEFPIFQSDKEFYEKISPTFGGRKYMIPFPTLCPEERQRRRLMFRNERKLYKRKCDLTGKSIISIYAPESPYKVYEQKVWRGDDWDPMDYGKEFNFSKSFGEQFEALMLDVPWLNLMDMNNEDSEYTNYTGRSKQVYMGNDIMYSEGIIYSNIIKNCIHALDLTDCKNCSNSAYLIRCKDCHQSFYCDACIHVQSSYYLHECKNCRNCFFSSGLHGKQNYILNKQVSDEEIQNIKQKIFDGTIKEYLSSFNNLINQQVTCSTNNVGSSNCYGNLLFNSENNVLYFESYDIQNCKYGVVGDNNVDCFDASICNPNCHSSYELISGGEQIKSCCNVACGYTDSVYYSQLCMYSDHLFGCVGLRNKSYCIFNKQYTKEEYERLVPKIIAKMQEERERGEFFDPSLSPFGYNETIAQEYFPLTREEALNRGYKRQDKEYPINVPEGMKTISGKDLPNTIEEVDDSILQKAIICEVSGKPFRIIKPELQFYKKYGIPLPRKHPDVRHAERLSKRPGRTLYLRTCDKCGIEMLSVYRSSKLQAESGKQNDQQKVYCEQCYKREIYG